MAGTLEGYRWDNSANVRAQQEGRPSNADIGSMSSEEYNEYIQQQLDQVGDEQSKLPGQTDAFLDSPLGRATAFVPTAGLSAFVAPSSIINEVERIPDTLAGVAERVGDVFGFGRETTTEHQQKIADRLAAQNQEDALYQDLVQGMRESIDQGPADKPYFGKYDTWDEYKAAGLNAENLAGQAGVLEAVGGLNLTLPQIHQVTQRLIDEDLLFSEKGAVKARDPERAREIAESFKVQDAFEAPGAPLAQARPEAEQGPMILNSRQMVESDTDVDPPITGFEQVDGAMLPPPGAADKAALAFGLLQSAPSRSLESQLFADAFQTKEKQTPLGFAQLQGAFR